jgi:ubiquinol-cytochrome c reductase cytochrome b subunit
MNATPETRREKFFVWLDQRTGAVSAARRWSAIGTPGAPWLSSLWPSVILFVFVVQLITGLVLWMYYSPSTQTAWESVYYVQHQVTLGWLLRGMHYYAAQVLVALLGLYIILMVVSGAYRRPREFVFWASVAMGMIALALVVTGNLLPWDQRRLSATQTQVGFLMLLPQVGGELYRVVLGGPTFNHLTLSRFLALHVGVLTPVFLGLLVLHRWFLRRAARVEAAGSDAVRGQTIGIAPGRAYWPDQFVRNAAACVAVMAVILLLVFQNAFTGDHAGQPPGDYLGVPLGAPADTDPASAYAAARPEWSFRGLHALSLKFSGPRQIIPIFVLPHLALLLVLAMPLIAYWRPGHAINVIVLLALVGGLAYLAWGSYRNDARDPDYLAAVAQGQRVASRAAELAREGPVPPAGALALVRTDPYLHGPELFAQHCAICHGYSGPEGQSFAPDEPTAPDLFRFASRDWIEGLLDAERIAGPDYYGNTRFAAGIMTEYVQGHFAGVEEDDRQAIVAALSAEARLPAQAEIDAADVEQIARGRELIVSEGCTRCHQFHQHGVAGEAPSLTGYGSREWLIGMIANPAHPWFYGVQNDDMPAYFPEPEQPEQNQLSADELQTLVAWLRGPAQGAAESAAASDRQTPLMLELGKWQARRPEPPDEPDPDDLRAQAMAIMQLAQCTLCHDYSDGQGGGWASHQPVAPSLWDFASRQWLQGLLDPEQIDGPRYFGNNPNFSSGLMVGYVQDSLYSFYLPDVGAAALEQMLEEAAEEETQVEFAVEYLAELAAIDEEELRQRATEAVESGEFEDFVREHEDALVQRLGHQRLDTLIDAIASQREWDEPQEMDDAMVALFADFGCADCHQFHDAGYLGMAPDITGYGSRDWLTGMITNPEDERFYPDSNDGMPAYHAFVDEPHKNLLTPEQIQLLADLIRGRLD